MTHAAFSPLIGPEFDEFLGASIGEDRNGTGLSVLSAFARLNVDPWEEATSLARMPRKAAVVRLNALIDALPSETAIDIPAKTIAADLVGPSVVTPTHARNRLASCEPPRRQFRTTVLAHKNEPQNRNITTRMINNVFVSIFRLSLPSFRHDVRYFLRYRPY